MPSSITDPGSDENATRCRNIAAWTPRDAMEYWADGTSNQLLLAEKHIPSWALTLEEAPAAKWNGGYQHTASGGGAYNTARPVSANKPNMIAFGPNDETTSSSATGPDSVEGQCALGSSHAGVFNVLIGDGSVRALTKTIPVPTMVALTRTSDGTPVTLP
jgi:hypothetical protein